MSILYAFAFFSFLLAGISSLVLREPFERDLRLFAEDVFLEEVVERAYVEQALIEVCRSLLYLGELQGCVADESFVWSFLLENGVSGRLSDVYALPVSASFSCARAADYGRYLLVNSLPEPGDFFYDLSGLGSGSDPCGYTEIVYK